MFEVPAAVAQGSQPNQVLGYLPTDEEWRFPNMDEDMPQRGPSRPMDLGQGEDIGGDKK